MERTTIYAAVYNASGSPDFHKITVKATQEEIDNGDHYDKAKIALLQNNYEEPFVLFDDTEAPAWFVNGINNMFKDIVEK